jgi:aryl-alcohol dehydrogenase-like predicted oxidoreductase
VEQLKHLAEREGMTVAQLAIAWVLAVGKPQPAIDVAIVGARNSEQLEQTALAGEIHLTQATFVRSSESCARLFPLEDLLQKACKEE